MSNSLVPFPIYAAVSGFNASGKQPLYRLCEMSLDKATINWLYCIFRDGLIGSFTTVDGVKMQGVYFRSLNRGHFAVITEDKYV